MAVVRPHVRYHTIFILFWREEVILILELYNTRIVLISTCA